MRALVIGGAGYVGSSLVRRYADNGWQWRVYDNLSRGHRGAIPDTVDFNEGDIRNTNHLQQVIESFRPEVIFHYAAYALVGESMKHPDLYYDNNTAGMHSLLMAMQNSGVNSALVFSSTCAVFGTPDALPMAEDDPKHPESPYGRSKWMCEQMIADYCQAYGMRAVALRYFNAAGADLDGAHGEDHVPETHLIPNLMTAARDNRPFTLFGNDFATKDGTCVRDYVHVLDLAQAHTLAATWLETAAPGTFMPLHLGTGNGYSNLEVLRAVEAVVGKAIKFSYGDRRPGDPAALYADASKVQRLLGWRPEYSNLDTICRSAWAWHSSRAAY